MSFRTEICEILMHSIIVFIVYKNSILHTNLKVFGFSFHQPSVNAELLDLILQKIFPKKSYLFLVSIPKTTNYRVPLGMMFTS